MKAPHALRDLGLAFTQLTVAPIPVRWPEDGSKPDIAGFYPLVGVVLGAVELAVMLLARPGSVMAYGVAVAAAALVAALTRGMHWDGLADVADGWGGWSEERRLEIMKDSALGAFGTIAIVFGVAIQSIGLASLAGTRGLMLLPAILGLSRFSATFAAWIGKPARSEGLGAAVCRRPGAVGIAAAALTFGAVAWWCWHAAQLGGVIVAVVGVAFALVVPDVISRRFGGVTGDVLGASILACELGLLVVSLILFGG